MTSPPPDHQANVSIKNGLLTLLIVVLTLVAAGIAFFVTCLGIALQSPDDPANAAVAFGTAGLVAGIVVVIGIGFTIYVALSRRKKRNSPPTPGDHP